MEPEVESDGIEKQTAEEIKKSTKLEKENATQIIIDGNKIKRNQESQFLTIKDWTDETFGLK